MSWNRVILKNIASLRLTVGLLLWLALVCILGSIVPQQNLGVEAGTSFAKRFIIMLSLRDVFHSLWFLLPTAVLCMNEIACMYRWRKAIAGTSAMPRAGLHEVDVPGEADRSKLAADLVGRLRAGRWTVSSQGDEGVITGEKGRGRRFAPLIVHGSILMIILGALLGLFGFKGNLEIPVGRASDTVTLNNGTIMHLPFQIRCDDFRMELYDNGMPKEYRSEISFLQADRLARTASVLVNHPVSFGGVLVSQSGYNTDPVASIQVSSPAGGRWINAAEGAVIAMHDTGYKVHVGKVAQDVMGLGPVVQLVVDTPKGNQEIWVFKQIDKIRAMHPGIMEKMPRFDPSLAKPYTFSLAGVTDSHTTILGVNHDPGILFVGIGSVIFMAGICLIFMVSHEKVWISLETAQQGLRVTVCQRSNGRTAAVDPDIVKHLGSLSGVQS